MGLRQHLLLSSVKPPTLLNMKEWRLGWEHKFFLAILIASQVIGVISAFDCRFFIFHPECRGQYGKRSTLPAIAQQPSQDDSSKANDPNLDLNPDLEDDNPLKIYCSRYVFAPICRGVTSKRGTISPLVGNDHAIYDLILQQIKKELEENKSDNIDVDVPSHFDSSEQVNEDTKGAKSNFKKRSSWSLSDIGPGFTSFYRKRYNKRQAPYLEDLDTFTSFIKKKRSERSNDVNDLGLFTTFYKKSDKNFNNLPQHKAIDDLSSFTTFYKRAADNNARYRRQALEDLGAFTTFMKKDNKQLTSLRSNSKRSTRSIS